MIDWEVDGSDFFEGFMMLYLIVGGIGLGLGFFLFERLNDRFFKKIIQIYFVFFDMINFGDVVVYLYNSMFIMRCFI